MKVANLVLSVLLGFGVVDVAAAEVEPMADGLVLHYVIDRPDGMVDTAVKRVVVLVHGSGPESMDEDLTALTIPAGTPNLFFRDVSSALVSRGFVVLRYDKRSYELASRVKADAAYAKSADFQRQQAHPLRNLVEDLRHFAELTHKRFPAADVYLLGHSEGTQVALRVADQVDFIKGVALIGFTGETLDSAFFEQLVYRQLGLFRELDRNVDGVIDATELAVGTPLAKALQRQLGTLDQDGDGRISETEFKAGNYVSRVLRSIVPPAYAADEASLPKPLDIIARARFRILFLQGEWDNQTPAYQTHAVQIANRLVWKKDTLDFVYFPRAGHALDPRDSINDLHFRKTPDETLKQLGGEMDRVFP
jgi:pimeloyl-ACP methyl ester carboxylesterase